MRSDSPSFRLRVRGCLLGGAIGDALGAPVEFMSLGEIRGRHGPEGVTGFAEAYGRVGAITDDTQMTLFTGEGLIRARARLQAGDAAEVAEAVHRAYLRWLATQGEAAPEPDGWLAATAFLHHRRAPGNTCLSALRSGTPGTIGRPVNHSKGCGGVMRIAPVGLIVPGPFRLAAGIAALTHGHPSGYLAAGALAVIVSRLVAGDALDEAVAAAIAEARTHRGHEETVEALERAVATAATNRATAEAVEALGEGWVAEEALAMSVFCALAADDFLSGVLLAVNHGGDSDSTGAITGSILGTLLGAEALPAHLRADLEGGEVIGRLAEDLVSVFGEGRPPDPGRYPSG